MHYIAELPRCRNSDTDQELGPFTDGPPRCIEILSFCLTESSRLGTQFFNAEHKIIKDAFPPRPDEAHLSGLTPLSNASIH
jgi:hypothetical protein